MKCSKSQAAKLSMRARDAFYTFAAHERVMDDFRSEGQRPPARLRNGMQQALRAYKRLDGERKRCGTPVLVKDHSPAESVRARAAKLRRRLGL